MYVEQPVRISLDGNDWKDGLVGDLAFCDACFTGNYPMEVPGRDISLAFE